MLSVFLERWLGSSLAVDSVGGIRSTDSTALSGDSRPAPAAGDDDPARGFQAADQVQKQSVSSGRVPSRKSIAEHTLDFFNATSEKMDQVGSSGGNAIAEKSTSLAEGVEKVGDKAKEGVGTATETVGTAIGGGARIVGKGVAGIFGFIGSVLGGIFRVVWSLIKGVFGVIGSVFSGLWTGLKEGVTGKSAHPSEEATPDEQKKEATGKTKGVNDKQRQILARITDDIDATQAQLIAAVAKRDAQAVAEAQRRAAVQYQDLRRLIQTMKDKGYEETAEYKRMQLLEASLQKAIDLQKTMSGLDAVRKGQAAAAEVPRYLQRAEDQLAAIDTTMEEADRNGLGESPEFSRLLSVQTILREALDSARKAPPPQPVTPVPKPPVSYPQEPTPVQTTSVPKPVTTPPQTPATRVATAPPEKPAIKPGPVVEGQTDAVETVPASDPEPSKVTATGVTDVPNDPAPKTAQRTNYREIGQVEAPANTGRFAGLKLPASAPWDQLNERDVQDFIADIVAGPDAADFRAAFPQATRMFEAVTKPAASPPTVAKSRPANAGEGDQADQANEVTPPRSSSGANFKYQLAAKDTLQILARRFYQDEQQWRRIYDVNKEKLAAWQKRHPELLERYNVKYKTTEFPNPYLYPTGMILEIPIDGMIVPDRTPIPDNVAMS